MPRRTRNSSEGFNPKTSIVFCADTSLSMEPLHKVLQDGVDEFVSDQKHLAEQEGRIHNTNFKLIEFNSEKTIIYDGPISDFTGHQFVCRGTTRLYDSVTEESTELLKKMTQSTELRNLGAPKPKAVLVVMTDGQNNVGSPSPREMREAIKKIRTAGVITTFMGANQDARETGVNYGFSQDASITFSAQPHTTVAAMRAVSSGTQRALSQPSGGDIIYSPMERQQSCDVRGIPPPLRRANAQVFNQSSMWPFSQEQNHDSDSDIDVKPSKKRRL